MIKQVLFVLVFALGANSALAQDSLARPETPWERKALGITPEQAQKRQAILQKYMPQLQAISKKYDKDAAAYRKSKKTQTDTLAYQSAIKRLKAESAPVLAQVQKEIDALYTPAQRAKRKAFDAKIQKTLQKPSHP